MKLLDYISKMKKNTLLFFINLISSLGVYTINSTCVLGLGQPEEPTCLTKYKK